MCWIDISTLGTWLTGTIKKSLKVLSLNFVSMKYVQQGNTAFRTWICPRYASHPMRLIPLTPYLFLQESCEMESVMDIATIPWTSQSHSRHSPNPTHSGILPLLLPPSPFIFFTKYPLAFSDISLIWSFRTRWIFLLGYLLGLILKLTFPSSWWYKALLRCDWAHSWPTRHQYLQYEKEIEISNETCKRKRVPAGAGGKGRTVRRGELSDVALPEASRT